MLDRASRPPPTRTIAVLVVLTLAVTIALAWSGWSARREHRRVAEATARDYARFAATLAASNVEAAVDQVLVYAFYGPLLAEREGSLEPVSPATLATNPPEMGRCDDDYPDGRWFVRVGPEGRMDVEGPLDPQLGRWLGERLVMLQRGSSPSRYGNLFPGDDGVIAYRLRRTEAGEAVEAHALAHCFADREGRSVFDQARRRTPLLPPGVSGVDSLVAVSVTDPRGDIVYSTGDAGAAAVVGVREADRSGPLEGLTFTVSVPGAVAQALVTGGIPAGGWDATWMLVVLAVGLGAATILQVHRSVVLVRARERFVANVSHELRTPLQLVLMFAQLLRLGRVTSDEEREEALGIIEREARRLVGMVERALAFTGAGRPVPGEELEAVDLHDLARETVEAFRPLAEEEGVILDLDFAAGLPNGLGSSQALRQVLFNLLDNAVRYGPRGQRVTVRAAVEDGWIDLMVDDGGPGIPPHERQSVWQPFRRLESNGGTTGSGLGLAVVRDKVEMMGGRTWIEDSPRGGTRVVVRLPAHGGTPAPGVAEERP